MKVGDQVRIINEEGVEESEFYNVKEIKGKFATVASKQRTRKITVDRLIGGADMAEQSENVEEVKEKPKAKGKATPVQFEKSVFKDIGTLFKKKGTSSHGGGNADANVERYYVVNEDCTMWRSFQTYNGSLGKKNKIPALKDISNENLNGNKEAIQTYLEKKGYEPA
jgi:hypothetical protein